MLILKDTVELRARPREVYDWFQNLPENYRDWHADHVSCRYIKGNQFEVSSVLYVEEYLHGRLHKLHLRLISIEPGKGFRYRIAPGLQGTICFTPVTSGTKLEAMLCIGWNAPGIGPLVDFVVKKLFQARLAELLVHMREEGQNLVMLFDGADKAWNDEVSAGERGASLMNGAC